MRRSVPGALFLIAVLILGALPGARSQAAGDPSRHAAPNGPPARAPQPFEENRGQAGPAAGFLTRGSGYVARLDSEGIDLALPDAGSPDASGSLRIGFLAGRAVESPAGIERLPGVVNYLAGGDRSRWITGAPTFAAVRYAAIYDGIDLTLRGDHRRLALDFALEPHADAGKIALDLDAGALPIERADDGAILLDLGTARLRFAAPALTSLEFDGHRLTLRGAGGEPETERVLHLTIERIDPARITDEARVAVDRDGNVYLAGRSAAAAFAPDGRSRTETPAASATLFVSRRDRDAVTPRFTTYLGGGADDRAIALVAGEDGGTTLTGATRSADFPGTEETANARGPQSLRTHRDEIGFVAHLDADGGTLAAPTRLDASPIATDEARGRIARETAGRVATARSAASRDLGEVTDAVVDAAGRTIVAGFDRTGGWRPGRLVQPAPAGGLLYAGPLPDGAPSPEAAGCPGTIQFDNSAGTGLWQTTTNWDLDRLPTSTDDVCIPTGFTITMGTGALPISTLFQTAGSSLTLSTGGSLSVAAASTINGSLTLANGTVTGAGTLDVNTTITWNSGTMTGAGTVNANAGLSFSGGAVKDVTGSRSLVTAGTTTWTGTGGLRVGTGGAIHNDGIWDAQSNASIALLGAAPAQFENRTGATFKKTGSAGGTTTIDIPFDNLGTLDIQNGLVNLSNGGTGSATFQGSAGTTLRFGGGTYTLGALSSVNVPTLSVTAGTVDVSGAVTAGATSITSGSLTFNPAATVAGLGGNLTVGGGTLTLGSNEAINLSSLTLSGGTVQGGDTVSVSGMFNWSGGLITGSGTVNSNGPLNLSGAGVKDLTQSRILNVNAATTWTGTGSVRMGTSAVIHNAAFWSAQSDATLTNSLGGTVLFDNKATATFRKSAGTGTTTADVPFDNLGAIDIQTGTVSLTGGGTGSGPITGATGTTVRFGGGAHTLGAGSSVAVPNLSVTAGTLDVTCPINVGSSTSITSGTLTFNPAAGVTSLGTALSVGGGTLNLNSGEAIGLSTLTLSGGTLQGSDNIAVSGNIDWSGGVLTGSGTVNANGGVSYSGPSVKDLTGTRTLITAGTTHWSGPVRLGGSASIQNNGTWQSENDGTLSTVGAGTGTFENPSGSFLRKTAGTGATTISVPFNSGGGVDVQTGTLTLAGGGTGTGSFGGSADATLTFGGGTHTLTSASSVTVPTVTLTAGSLVVNGAYGVTTATGVSAGTMTFNPTATLTGLGPAVTIASGTLTLNSGEAIHVNSLSIAIGTLAGSDPVTVDGSLSWSSGEMNGATTTTLANGGAISGPSVKDLTGGRQLVTTTGTVTWTGTGPIRLGAGATVDNQGAAWQVQSDAGFTNLGAGGHFINHATASFTKTAGAGATSFGVALDNDGLVAIQSGIVDLSGGGVTGGSFTGTAGTTLRVSAGTYTMAGSSSVAVPTVSVTNGTLDVHGSYAATSGTSVASGTLTLHPDSTPTAVGGAVTISSGTLDLSSGEAIGVASLALAIGALQGSDTLSVSGGTTWTSGNMTGTGVTSANGGIALSGPSVKDLFGSRRLNTSGTSTLTGTGSLRLSPTAVVHNDGTWDVQSDVSVVRIGGPTGGLFENAAGGLFRKTAGAATTGFDVPFTNAGSVQGSTGTISFIGGLAQTAGSISAQGGTITASAPLDIQGGTIGGTSTFNVGVVNGGHLAPGLSPGSVSITGALTQGAGSSFDVEIGGLTPGTQHDRVVVGAAASLGGTLNVTLVNGFTPADHDLFTIMTFPSSTGEFSTFNFPPLPGGMVWKYLHNPTSIVLEALADLDGDGVSNAIDCLPNDPTVWSIPAEATGVAVAVDQQTISWSSLAAQAGPAIVYDVMRGQISQLPTGGGAAETCLISDTAALQVVDATPPVGSGFYYLVRGVNACGIGTYGNRSNGTPRTTLVCP